MKTIFITGTDTEVGKTLVASALVDYWVTQGFKTSGFKPVAAGAEYINGELQNEDAQALQMASNVDLPYSTINPIVFEQATAPHIAASLNSQVIEIKALDDAYYQHAKVSERVVVEGAGGWQVPINDDNSFADWVASHQWPVLLVVNIKLGCINHTSLSYRDIVRYNNPLVGWVANCIDSNTPYANEMITTLQKTISAPLIGIVPTLNSTFKKDINKHLNFTNLLM